MERPRSRRTAGLVVAAAVAVAAVPVGLTLLDGDGALRDAVGLARDGGGERTETWRDLSVTVPGAWGNGTGFGWCADGVDLADADQVSRPGIVPTIMCDVGLPHGAHFVTPDDDLVTGEEGVVEQASGRGFPDGAWVGWRGTEQAAVVVVAEDRSTAQAVLDSATPVGEVDANGCATRLEMVAPSTAGKAMSVCRYDEEGWLEQSEVLTAEQSAQAADALEAAPRVDGARACPSGLTGEGPTIAMDGAGVSAQVVLEGECAGIQGSDGRVRQVGTEVLRWALSPGWSGDLSILAYEDDVEDFRLRTE